MKKQIPNFFTLLNLLSGSIGVIIAFYQSMAYAVVYIWIGAFFDVLDGLSARLLGTPSTLGKQLDSLADLITFGLLPSVIMYQLIQQMTNHPYLPFIALLMTLFSALRLAQFNIDKRQSRIFIGLPTPANALFISTIPLIIFFGRHTTITHFIAHPYTLIATVFISSFLLISKLKFMAFKFSTYTWRSNQLQYIFLLASNLLILFFQFEGISLSMLFYIVLSLLFQKSLTRLSA